MMSDLEQMVEPNPLRCPRCRGINITYLQDAAVFYIQRRVDEDTVIRVESTTNLYDRIIEPVCHDCGFMADEPDSSWE